MIFRRSGAACPSLRHVAQSLACGVFLLLCQVAQSAAPPLPSADGQSRAGVATCADSKCHDAERPWQTSKILQNEYRTWIDYSTHAESYTVLQSPLGRQIGTYLKLDPVTSSRCLDCHADNVPVAQRGKAFRLADGVGCEACHGGAEPWLENHVSMSGSRSAYLQAGLYPTEFPVPRAELCLGCHLGRDGAFVDHALLAAGHPRLVFELDTFFVNMPLHHREDSDYSYRKSPPPNAEFWLTGQIIAARRWLTLFLDDRHRMAGVLPEPAFQDCYGCHSVVWPGKGSKQARSPLRFDVAHLRMLTIVFADRQLDDAVRALEDATHVSVNAAQNAATRLQTLLMQPRFQPAPIETAGIAPLLQRLLDAGASQRFRRYIEAEQATMAIAALLRTLDAQGTLNADLERLFDATHDAEAFTASGFAQAVTRLQSAWRAARIPNQRKL